MATTSLTPDAIVVAAMREPDITRHVEGSGAIEWGSTYVQRNALLRTIAAELFMARVKLRAIEAEERDGCYCNSCGTSARTKMLLYDACHAVLPEHADTGRGTRGQEA